MATHMMLFPGLLPAAAETAAAAAAAAEAEAAAEMFVVTEPSIAL